MNSKLGLLTKLIRQNTRRFGTSESRYVSQAELEKIKQKQAYVQSKANEGVPIHIITGKVHYYITTALGVVVLGLSGHSIYNILNR